MSSWEYIQVRVDRIENGFLVTESAGGGYKHADNGKLFFPDMAGVERELVVRLRAATGIDLAQAKEDF